MKNEGKKERRGKGREENEGTKESRKGVMKKGTK